MQLPFEYSAVEHLSRSLLIWNIDRHLMVMLAGYFDASGGVDQHATVVSGYVSTVERWVGFDMDWRLLLAKEHVPYFHMKEFAHSVGVFKDWKGNETRRARFLSQLAEIIRAHAMLSVSTIVLHKAFRDADRLHDLSGYAGTPYSFCARGCAEKIREWTEKSGYGASPIDYIFEDGDEGKGELLRIFGRDGLPLPIFKPKLPRPGHELGVFTPLQAADFVAWEHQKATKQMEQGELKHLRKSLQALRPIEKRWGIFTPVDLLKFCRDNSIPLRAAGTSKRMAKRTKSR